MMMELFWKFVGGDHLLQVLVCFREAWELAEFFKPTGGFLIVSTRQALRSLFCEHHHCQNLRVDREVCQSNSITRDESVGRCESFLNILYKAALAKDQIELLHFLLMLNSSSRNDFG